MPGLLTAPQSSPSRPPKASLSPVWTIDDLAEADFDWTIIDGQVLAIDGFIPSHPGGRLILSAVGREATDLFRAHHASQAAEAALEKWSVGRFAAQKPRKSLKVHGLRAELNRRVSQHLRKPQTPLAEAVAASMLLLFFFWAFLVYVQGYFWLNLLSGWFWWRHLDAALHSVAHGDFRYSPWLQHQLLRIYGVLCHHMLDHYQGGSQSISQHLEHHLHTNDFRRDPDWTFFAVGRNWIRRHPCNPWQPYNAWQTLYWLPVKCILEPVSEIFTMLSTCMNGASQVLEAPAGAEKFLDRCKDLMSWWVEALISPGYQGAAFFFQPFGHALAALLLSRAVTKLVLLPFAEVQHFLMPDTPGDDEEFVVRQLATTANLRFTSSFASLLDFLMFHGDSLQVEHHLWPAMSFVELREASRIVKVACAELGLPYQEIGYFEAFHKVWRQVRDHAIQPE
ncbi:fadA [Symbiodinium pilosum]|uniref:FadA protein n=1 Tax=Symbiodinium pilosum TaxID=2952 RepID=A0A812T6X0_SYMPI|nr:fadA [Symbiodinium pilosum]